MQRVAEHGLFRLQRAVEAQSSTIPTNRSILQIYNKAMFYGNRGFSNSHIYLVDIRHLRYSPNLSW